MHCCAADIKERKGGGSGKNVNRNTRLQLPANKQATTSTREQTPIHHFRHQMCAQVASWLSLLLSFIIQFNFQRLAVTSTARCELIVYLFNQFNSSGDRGGGGGWLQLMRAFSAGHSCHTRQWLGWKLKKFSLISIYNIMSIIEKRIICLFMVRTYTCSCMQLCKCIN